MNNQTENLRYSQAIKNLLNGDASYISRENKEIVVMLTTNNRVIKLGAENKNKPLKECKFTTDDYFADDWFIG